MTNVELSYPVEPLPQRVNALLLDASFLLAFVEEQGPTERSIEVDHDRRRSALSWTMSLEGELPSLVTRFVGRTVTLHLIFDLGKSRIDMTAQAKRRGILACAFHVVGHGHAGSVLSLDGSLEVSGPLGGLAESAVLHQVVEPVLREDLVRLLNTWGTERQGVGFGP